MQRVLPIMVLAALLGAPSCLQIDGGAVEVAWVIRDSRQKAAKCNAEGLLKYPGLEEPIARIRLSIQRVGDDGVVGEDLCAAGVIKGCTFDCENSGGTTPFNIPVPDTADPSIGQEYVFSLVPLTADGSPISPAIVAVPPPIRRRIISGDLTDLGLWMVVVPNMLDVPSEDATN